MKNVLALLTIALATVAIEPVAAAEGGGPFEVLVRPEGQPWSIGEHGSGTDCSPTCTLHLTPKRYRISMGTTSEEVLLDGPSEIAYRSPVRALRYGGGAIMGAGLIAGGSLIAAAALVCAGDPVRAPDGSVTYVSSSCPSPKWSRTTRLVLVGVGAGSFGAAVVGGILFYLGGESIRVRDLSPKSALSPSRFTLDVTGSGATLGWTMRF